MFAEDMMQNVLSCFNLATVFIGATLIYYPLVTRTLVRLSI